MYFFSKNNSIYPVFNDQRFNDTFTNDIVSFEQLGPGAVTNLQWLELLMSRTKFHGPKDVRAIRV